VGLVPAVERAEQRERDAERFDRAETAYQIAVVARMREMRFAGEPFNPADLSTICRSAPTPAG
jgi:hypothetical protein